MTTSRLHGRWGHVSLKQHIGILGILALVTLLCGTGLAMVALRQTESARVAGAVGVMEVALDRLVQRYDYLRGSFEAPDIHRLRLGDDRLLQSLTEAVLVGFPGMEGGFYASQEERLIAYAYPTYPGSGPKTDIPAAERPTIQRVAASAVADQGSAEERIAAGTDLLLFRAQTVFAHGQPVGAAWVMYRLNGIRGGAQEWYMGGLIGMLILAVSVAVAAWWLTRRLDRGVAEVEGGLLTMEEHLDAKVPLLGILELDRIGAAINRLGSTLLDHHKRRAELEGRLRQADRLAALGQLVAGVAHELRNPLASIKLKLQLMRRDVSETSRLMEAVRVIDAEVGRLNRLVERLLLLAKPAQRPSVPTNLDSFLNERIEVWRSRAGAQGAVLEWHPGEGMTQPIPMDRDRIGQIVDNLIANALDALQPDQGGMIRVEAARESTDVVLAVTDTGPGVPSDVVSRLFEPFFTTRAGGTGLGLFLSAEIARTLGGDLRYCERSERGARFELRFPC